MTIPWVPYELFSALKAESNWKSIAQSFGYFFFGLGVLLLLLIIYAMATRLVH